MQRLAGLSEQTEVTLSDIGRFEQILNRKIVVFHRSSERQILLPLQTDFPKSAHPLYLFLFQNHYYGIKNVKGLLGSKQFCVFCHRGYERREKHYITAISASTLTALVIILKQYYAPIATELAVHTRVT